MNLETILELNTTILVCIILYLVNWKGSLEYVFRGLPLKVDPLPILERHP